MPTAKTSVTVNAPIEKVFDAIADPEKTVQFAPVTGVSNIKGNPGEKGSSAEFEYHVLGMKFHMIETVSAVEKPRKLLTEDSGAFASKWEWILAPQDGATKVDVKVDYSVPGGILGKIANQLLLEQMNQKNLDSMAHGLKIYCEA